MALTVEGQRMVARGKVIAARGKLTQAEAFVEVYEQQGDAVSAEAWREVLAGAHADLMAAVVACESL